MSSKDSDFQVMIVETAAGKQEAAGAAFAQAFGLDAGVAQQIVKSAPIIFLTNASKAEIKAITPRLIEVSKAGLEFRITMRPAQRVPKVNWPVRPQFALGAGPSDGGSSATFNLENNAFVCPSCGETFLFKKLGRLPLGEYEEAAAAPAPAPTPAPAPAPKPVAPAKAAAPAPAAKPAPKPAPPPPPAEEEPLELLDEPGAAAEEAPLEAPAEEAPELPALDAPGDDLLAEPAAAAPVESDDLLAPPGGEEPLQLEAEADAAPPPLPGEEPAEEAAAAPVAELEAPAEEPAPMRPAGDTFNVFLSKISAGDKKEQAAKLISEIKKCPIAEARELAGRLIIPLLKDVSKPEAESALNKFKAIKITGRMTLSRKK